MTDGKFKWLTGCVTVAVVAIAGMVIFSPDKPTAKPAKEKSGLGEYVYVDNRKIVHADRKCSRLNYKGLGRKDILCTSLRWMNMALIAPNA